MSEINTPASSTTEEKNAPTLAEVVRKYKTSELIDFLRNEEDLELDDEDCEIIRNQKVNGRAFLRLTEEKLRSYGMKGGPATVLAEFAKELSKRKLRSFSSYRSLKEVLKKYDIEDNRITAIPQFLPSKFLM
jgi:hypothetical protein